MQYFILHFLVFTCLISACAQSKPTDGDSKEVVCFVYHRFGDDRFPSTNVSLQNFEAHLKYLSDHDYQVVTFGDAIDYLKSDEAPKKTAVITIDDGYTSFFKHGLPLLQKFDFPATLFINTETIGGTDYMGWQELKDAMQAGVEIGNHTHSHAYFLNLPESRRYDAFSEELKKSQDLIKSHLDVEPKVFAYPYGEYDLKMKQIVRDFGFKGAAAQNSGVMHADADLMLCPRFPMAEAYAAPEKFASKAQMHALKTEEVTPQSPLLADNNTPELSFKVKNEDLNLNQLQCFVQGSECQVLQKDRKTIRLKSTSTIANRRRTLYTITVPDAAGQWYWFSHLWINADIK